MESVSARPSPDCLSELQGLEVQSELADVVVDLVDGVGALSGRGGGGEGARVAWVPKNTSGVIKHTLSSLCIRLTGGMCCFGR